MTINANWHVTREFDTLPASHLFFSARRLTHTIWWLADHVSQLTFPFFQERREKKNTKKHLKNCREKPKNSFTKKRNAKTKFHTYTDTSNIYNSSILFDFLIVLFLEWKSKKCPILKMINSRMPAPVPLWPTQSSARLFARKVFTFFEIIYFQVFYFDSFIYLYYTV